MIITRFMLQHPWVPFATAFVATLMAGADLAYHAYLEAAITLPAVIMGFRLFLNGRDQRVPQ